VGGTRAGMNERDLYRAMILGAQLERWALYRIADGSPGKKPFDIGGCCPQGYGVGLEVKISKARAPAFPRVANLLPWSQFEVHQIMWLKLFAESGAMALAAIYYEDVKELRIYRLYVGAHTDDEGRPNARYAGQLTKQENLWIGWGNLDLKLPS
jgi:hypothetical protein